MQVNMLEAKTHLSKLVEAALRGEEVVIANRGKPVVKLVRAEVHPKRRWGAWEGLVTEAQVDAAFDPKFEAELAAEWQAWADKPIEPVTRIKPPEPGQRLKTKQASKAKRV